MIESFDKKKIPLRQVQTEERQRLRIKQFSKIPGEFCDISELFDVKKMYAKGKSTGKSLCSNQQYHHPVSPIIRCGNRRSASSGSPDCSSNVHPGRSSLRNGLLSDHLLYWHSFYCFGLWFVFINFHNRYNLNL